jgi:hypothetical protein
VGQKGGEVDTYSDYSTDKIGEIGQPHPSHVVETSALSSVPLPVVIRGPGLIALPQETIREGLISRLQVQ